MAALRSWLNVFALVLVVVTGCAPATTTPSIAPSPVCTPEAGGAAYPCSQHDYDQMIAKDKLYAEAEAVYRKFLAENERINRTGGVTTLTPVLLETTTGEFRDDVLSLYRELHRIHATAKGGRFIVAWVHRVPGASKDGSVAALRACTDSRTVTMGADGASGTPGLVNELTSYFVREGDALKIAAATYKVVSAC